MLEQQDLERVRSRDQAMEHAQPPPGGDEPKSIWRDLVDAIRGNEQDFTQGNLNRAILLLAVPMVLEMAMESVFSIIDVFFVARLGSGAVAVVGITESLLTLIFAIAIGLSMATTAMVARRIGEKAPEKAAVVAVQSIAVGVIVSLVVGVLGIVFAADLLRLMGASADVIDEGYRYTAIMLGGNVVIMMLFLINAIFRGAGDAAIAMRVLWIANLVNIALDPCFIFGLGPFPELGVTGAAVATNIGRGTGVALQLWFLFKGRGRVVVRKRHLRLEPAIMARLLRVSIGGIGQFLLATSSWIFLVRIISRFGSTALAGYTIGLRLIIFAILPSWGLSNAAATLVGQNLGAGNPSRAERSVWRAGFYNMVFLAIVAVIFIVLAESIVAPFTDDPEVVPHAVKCLRYLSAGYIFYAYGMVMVQSFNGAGDTFTPSVINFFCYWLLQIPLAWVLAVTTGHGPAGVFIAIVVSESVIAIVGVWIFRKGHWKSKVI